MEIEQEHFKKIKEIAECNIAISKAREELSQLKTEHDSYLVARETEATEKIQEILTKSDVLLKNIYTNHIETSQIVNTVVSFAEFVASLSKKTSETIENFKNAQDLFTQNIIEKEKMIDSMKKDLEIDRESLEETRKKLERMKKDLETRESVLDGRVKVLAKAYEAEKLLWEKIKK